MLSAAVHAHRLAMAAAGVDIDSKMVAKSQRSGAIGVHLMKFLVTVLGVMLVFEGVPWFLSPAKVRSMLARLQLLSDTTLRRIGLALMLFGLLLVHLAVKG